MGLTLVAVWSPLCLGLEKADTAPVPRFSFFTSDIQEFSEAHRMRKLEPKLSVTTDAVSGSGGVIRAPIITPPSRGRSAGISFHPEADPGTSAHQIRKGI